jgi:hypothetical protein
MAWAIFSQPHLATLPILLCQNLDIKNENSVFFLESIENWKILLDNFINLMPQF